MRRAWVCWVFVLGLAGPAWAGRAHSLALTFSPVGGFLLTQAADGKAAGYSMELGWSYRRDEALVEVGGHVASSRVLTTATPLSVRLTPFRESRLRPSLGLGASFLIPHVRAVSRQEGHPGLLVGLELSGGLEFGLQESFFLCAEAYYQNFSAQPEPLSGERQGMSSVFLGMGVRL
ncbi:hypothetical protein SAMN05444354_101259 [Stigmatella aurantiaca]|uniref:Outer membrane protein beta-barrel domain-containing protein n=1 Tax=Stigmatella aurantiaca TaxID=41 RepID=A0A1H7G1H5_STIAU|nr:hypothetical protein [Stigmatella aurantiaca]SEK31377.1 hypothetical protein SAMN05444354_101259 [Stigmatella aurantiaca]